jgi:DNA-binding GntR family transcriptional regulator
MEASPTAISRAFARAPVATVAKEVFSLLYEKIIQGEWLPGQRLSENEVAQSLGISRTPVREALIRLGQVGLVSAYPQVGTVVSPIRLSEVYDNQFLRETIECRTVSIAAERCTDKAAAKLRDLIERQLKCCTPGREAGFFALDDEMHRSLIELAGRPAIWRVLRDAKAQLDRVRHLSLHDIAWIRRNIAEHQEIVRQVVERNGDGAAAAMRKHLSNVFQTIERISRENPQFFEAPPAETAAEAGA